MTVLVGGTKANLTGPIAIKDLPETEMKENLLLSGEPAQENRTAQPGR